MRLSARALVLLAVALPAAAAAAGAHRLSPTVQAQGLTVSAQDLLLTPKAAYTHVLWDVFPARTRLDAAAEGRDREGFYRDFVQALARGPYQARLGGRRLRVDVVEIPLRDEYGAPQWSSVKKLARFELPAEATLKARPPAKDAGNTTEPLNAPKEK